MGLNSFACTGRLGQDPEVRYTKDGTAVANFSIAVNEYYNNAEGERQEITTWLNVVAWRKLGENVGKFLKKGSKVAVEGSIRGRSWEDKEGNKRYSIEVRATQVEFLDPSENKGRSNEDALPENIPDDEIPF